MICTPTLAIMVFGLHGLNINNNKTNIASASGDVEDSKGYTQIGNTLTQFGRISITPSAANVPTAKTVTFPIVFTGVPFINITPISGTVGTQVLGWGVSSSSTTNFVAYLTRTNTTTTSLYWQAIGYKA